MSGRKRRRILWIALTLLAVVVLAVAFAYNYFQRCHFEPWQYLLLVEQAEPSSTNSRSDQITTEMLGWSLAILGRDDEVRQMDRPFRFEVPASTVAAEELELSVVPWDRGIQGIATKNRLVMIMEDHRMSKHREFIGATLPAFKDAGFTHYAAEAISQGDFLLARRGYPSKLTGLYTADPQFGNLIRSSLGLEFQVVGYDFRMTTHEEREEFSARRLAELFKTDAETRLLVHAGHSHVLKHETEFGQRWLASLLWEKTGIEPFTIWQWSSQKEANDYDKIIGELTARGVSCDEPVLLMPPPAFDCGLQDSPYRLGSVDAIVIHPPDHSVAPAKRTVLFPDSMQKLSGRWTASQWPVVVSAYKAGEPISAIPLDQVMLRQDESDFVLWVPNARKYEIRVFNRRGLLTTHVERDGDIILVGL